MTNSHSESLANLRNHLLNSMLLGAAIVAIPALAISLWRAVFLGWKPLMAVHIVLTALFWLLWFMRAQLPYTLRATSLLAIYWIVGIAGFAQFGPAAGSSVFLVMFAFAGMLFFSGRTGWWLVAFASLSVALLGFLASQHWLKFDLDFQVYAYHPLTWLNLAWALSAFSVILAYVGWFMVHGIREHDEATRELAERQRKIGLNIPGMIYQYLLRTDASSCFPYASEGIRNIYGVTPEEVKDDATPVFAVLHPDDLAHVAQTIQTSAHNLTEWQAEYRVHHPQKGDIWVEGHATPERLPNGDIIWHGFISDITERKKAETIKNEFVATVSHELRTPLTSIRGSLGLITGGVAGALPEQARSLVEIAHKNSERLGRLINDLLDMEKIASGKMVITLEPQSLMPLVAQSIAANQGYADLREITFQLVRRIESGTVNVDSERFQQVLANCLSNAAKFSPAGGIVEIAVDVQTNCFRVSVTDHGEGIPDNFKSHVFEKFSQADASDTRAKGGTGLGLAISKEIMERMHGQIGFDSVNGVGTTFWVELPAV